MRKDNVVVGRLGENLACEYLQRLGFRIIERNYRTHIGELDIVCWDGKILVFVEVKSKIGLNFGTPEEMVDSRKLSQVKRLGEIYCQKNSLDVPCRVDVVAVVFLEDKNLERIEHYKAVY